MWLFLDDSTAKDSYHSDGSLMWNASDNDAHYPKWVLKTKCFWLRVMWWSFIRNNSVNYASWQRTGGWVEPLKYNTLWGKFDAKVDKNDNNTYFFEGMYLIRVLQRDGKYHTRFTYVGNFLGKKQAVWMGFSQASGRFSFSQRR